MRFCAHSSETRFERFGFDGSPSIGMMTQRFRSFVQTRYAGPSTRVGFQAATSRASATWLFAKMP
jgi:hypothetical protein